MLVKKLFNPFLFSVRPLFRSTMAKSKFEYVRDFEEEDKCLPGCWIVVRIDGKCFHKFTEKHKYQKPNDERGVELMSKAATVVINDLKEIVIAYGQSDEFSFVFRKDTILYNRRKSKLMTNVVSLFSSAFVFNWKSCFGETPLHYPPSFDGRVILYPTDKTLRDYLSWRQVDTHINNLYNTTFWGLVMERDHSPQEAEERLRGTLASDKNEILFTEIGVNYNNELDIFRKGSTLFWKKEKKGGKKKVINICANIISDVFWEENKEILQS